MGIKKMIKEKYGLNYTGSFFSRIDSKTLDFIEKDLHTCVPMENKINKQILSAVFGWNNGFKIDSRRFIDLFGSKEIEVMPHYFKESLIFLFEWENDKPVVMIRFDYSLKARAIRDPEIFLAAQKIDEEFHMKTLFSNGEGEEKKAFGILEDKMKELAEEIFIVQGMAQNFLSDLPQMIREEIKLKKKKEEKKKKNYNKKYYLK